ncbi:MarR family winged helix-turn-helix transcriptional regulator [Paraburkholderia tagetis]|uniref:MarR family winged helix-turn-helix transcriptional regulator n=1 Tax=Paraburkholderia tagetis TaxID=2913261 RepID=A0A9X1UJJ4_9BURK|nr:MarR family winged helix-turn-helix transcriptional regulator [Paraburkholderia tagetis]MCG5077168.1 MarR family winged helix-turn-helix transcriptional regulator [Paraburkholderia tagetis]
MKRRAEAVLQFNRFYRKFLGARHSELPRTSFSLTEIRILRELESGRTDTAAALARDLTLDSGYLSRILAGFERQQLITRRASEADARLTHVSLTEAGRIACASLAAAAVGGVMGLLAKLSAAEQQQLVDAMEVVQRLLG